MIELLMLFAIGFLVASLFNLLFVPLVHNRAVRLTMRRLDAETPYSMAEIQAEKDQLRAEFAMSTRRLEMSVEQLKAKTAAQLNELGKKSMAIEKLKHELDEKTAAVAALEASENTTREQLRTTEQEYSTLKREKARLEQERDAAREEAARLKREAASLRQGTEATGAAERAENALLRERINDIAAEVARLTLALEGPGSPIEAILADEKTNGLPAAAGANGSSPAEGDATQASRGDLGERIRALQSRAARLVP